MASVYLATQESLDRDVALKVMLRSLASDDTFAQRFLREGPTVARLTHPNIVKVFDTGIHGDCYYMSMEYLSGGTLKQRLHRLSIEESLDIVKALGSALGYAHQQKIVHRDVKPQNVLFYESGSPVLSDFGIAKALASDAALTATGVYMGSASYMSPEQVRGETLDARSDLYALGVLFYEMLMGEPPYTGEDAFSIAYKHVTDPIPTLPPVLAAFQPVIDQLMAKRPQDRFVDAAALYQALKRAEIAYYVPTSPDLAANFSTPTPSVSPTASRENQTGTGRIRTPDTSTSVGLESSLRNRTRGLKDTKTQSTSRPETFGGQPRPTAPLFPPPRRRQFPLATVLVTLICVSAGAIGVYLMANRPAPTALPPAPVAVNPRPAPVTTNPLPAPAPSTQVGLDLGNFELPPVEVPSIQSPDPSTSDPSTSSAVVAESAPVTPTAPPVTRPPVATPATPPSYDADNLIPQTLDRSSNVSRGDLLRTPAAAIVPPAQATVPTPPTVAARTPPTPPQSAPSSAEIVARIEQFLASDRAEQAYSLLTRLPATAPERANLVERVGIATEAALSLSREQRRAIQKRLQVLRYDVGTPDGIFGEQTRRALRQAQATRSLPLTGYLNQRLLNELLSPSN